MLVRRWNVIIVGTKIRSSHDEVHVEVGVVIFLKINRVKVVGHIVSFHEGFNNRVQFFFIYEENKCTSVNTIVNLSMIIDPSFCHCGLKELARTCEKKVASSSFSTVSDISYPVFIGPSLQFGSLRGSLGTKIVMKNISKHSSTALINY